MKSIFTAILLAASTFWTSASETNTLPALRIGSYVRLQGGEGFLKYNGEHSGVILCALSYDTGSGLPEQDFRLYAKQGDTYRLVLSLPMLTHKGYRCIARGDILNVYVTRKREENRSTEDGNPVVVIDLQQIVKAHAEPDAAANGSLPIDILTPDTPGSRKTL